MRILPLTICVLIIFLGLRVFEGFNPHYDMAYAEEKAKDDAAKKDDKKDDKSDKKDADKKTDDKKSDDKKSDDKKDDKDAAKDVPDPNVPRKERKVEKLIYDQSEVDLLQALSVRRNELDERAKEMDQREALLKATEQRLNQRVDDLAGIKKEIGDLISKLDGHEEEKMRSLVKVYEAMKPKEAATIFNQMDEGILLNMFARMSEAKSALILAKMDPQKAQSVTVLLAKEGERLRDEANKRLQKTTDTGKK